MNPQQQKLISASDNFGNNNIKKQQGTTREIFDYIQLPVSGNPVPIFRFFEKLNLRPNFWQTNLNTNKLDVGESFLIERIWFSVAIDTGAYVSASKIDILVPLGTGNTGLSLAQWSWYNDNNTVIKNKSLSSHFPEFNSKSPNDLNYTKHLDTLISVQPLVPFVCTLRIPTIPIIIPRFWKIYIGCHAEGTGSLFAPKQKF